MARALKAKNLPEASLFITPCSSIEPLNMISSLFRFFHSASSPSDPHLCLLPRVPYAIAISQMLKDLALVEMPTLTPIDLSWMLSSVEVFWSSISSLPWLLVLQFQHVNCLDHLIINYLHMYSLGILHYLIVREETVKMLQTSKVLIYNKEEWSSFNLS